jgi:hypothetical protein
MRLNANPLYGGEMWKLGEGEFDWALELPPSQRYAYAVNNIREHGELWLANRKNKLRF